MESANSKYNDKRESSHVELPDQSTLSQAEILATRGMVLYDRLEQKTSEEETADTKAWDTVAKRKKLKRGLAQKK